MGPLTFPAYMDSLTDELLAAGQGIGVGISIPPEWGGHTWIGSGMPRDDLTERIMLALCAGAGLPPESLLAMDEDIEASALRAMDLLAPVRLAAILHADDPVLLSSSWGGAQQSLDVLAAWSFKYKASPHTKPDKNAIMVIGGPGHHDSPPEWDPCLLRLAGQPPTRVAPVPNQHWLGLRWRANLDLLPASGTS